jgi:exopolysaccharide production protein ExoZ
MQTVGTLVSTRERDRLDGVQAARGAAALLVLLYHAGHMLSLPQYVGWVPLGDVFEFGHAGVDFFFVLSGFIITYVHGADLGRPQRLPRYAWRRLGRIMPMYWIVLAIQVAILLHSSERAQQVTPGHLAASLMLVPYGRDTLLGVSWTLDHEMLFYVAFGLAVLWRPLAPVLAALGIALALAGPWLPVTVVSGYLACSYHLDFLLGILVAVAARRRLVPAPRMVAAAGGVAFLVAGFAENAGLLAQAGYASQACFGLASTAVLAGLVEAERRGKLRVGRALVVLGAGSYSIYLSHTIVIGLAAHTLASLGIMRLLPGWGAMVLGVGAGLGAGLALYWNIERPLTAMARRLETATRARAVRETSPAGSGSV